MRNINGVRDKPNRTWTLFCQGAANRGLRERTCRVAKALLYGGRRTRLVGLLPVCTRESARMRCDTGSHAAPRAGGARCGLSDIVYFQMFFCFVFLSFSIFSSRFYLKLGGTSRPLVLHRRACATCLRSYSDVIETVSSRVA